MSDRRIRPTLAGFSGLALDLFGLCSVYLARSSLSRIPMTRSASRLRALGTPRPVMVQRTAGGAVAAVRMNGRTRPVAQVREIWRIDDEWWREPISRIYMDIVLADGGTLMLFRDLMTRRWYAQ